MAKANKKTELSEEAIAAIRADVERWRPGLWAEENSYGGTCKCGLKPQNLVNNAKFTQHGKPNFACPVHRVDGEGRGMARPEDR